jgi:hypothetical protein
MLQPRGAVSPQPLYHQRNMFHVTLHLYLLSKSMPRIPLIPERKLLIKNSGKAIGSDGHLIEIPQSR